MAECWPSNMIIDKWVIAFQLYKNYLWFRLLSLLLKNSQVLKCCCFFFKLTKYRNVCNGAARMAEGLPLAIRILMLIFLVFHQHCTISRDRLYCKIFFGSTTGVATHLLSNQAVMNFRDLRNIEAAFFIPARYIYNKSCVLPCSASVGTSLEFNLNYQQCRLMCSLYVTKLGPS